MSDTWGLSLGDWGEIAAHWSVIMRDDMDIMHEYASLLDGYTTYYQEKFSSE
jgi:hypothetical protein